MLKRIATLVFCLVAIAGTGRASDYKTLSAGACHPIPVAWTFTPNTQIPYRWYGGAFGGELGGASPTNNVNIVCPLVRDDISNTNGLSVMTVYVYDSDPVNSISCSVVASSADGLQTFTSAVLSSGGAFVGNATLGFGATVNQSWNGGHYSVNCTDAAAASVIGIVYAEVAGGDTL